MPKKCAECYHRNEYPRCRDHIAQGETGCRFRNLPPNPYAAGNARVASYVAIIEQEQRESRSAPGMRISYEDKRMWNGAFQDGEAGE